MTRFRWQMVLLIAWAMLWIPTATAQEQPRPELTGEMFTHETPHFVVHYTLEGTDAVSEVDDNGDGIPDYVYEVGEAAEAAWAFLIEEQGWLEPLPDNGEGGDTRLDIYLEDQTTKWNDIYGYMESSDGFVGDNPNTEVIEDNAAYGYLGMDNDYAAEDDPLGIMRSTMAHELHHAIQSAYDDDDPHYWLYEATATWVEEAMYPELGEASYYLSDFTDTPDLCLLSVGADRDSNRWYGSWIFLQYIMEHHGGVETLLRLWDEMAVRDGLEALEIALTEADTTLTDVLVDFSVANLTKSNCPDNTPYCYANGSDYLRPYIENALRVDDQTGATLTPDDGVHPLAADYVRLRGDVPITLAFDGSEQGNWHLRLVGLLGEVVKVTSPENTVTPSDYDRLYLAVINTATVNAEEDCGYHNYTLVASPLADDIAPPSVNPDPGPYVPPSDERDSAAPVGDPLNEADAPFAPLYLRYLPPGYDFEQLWQYTEDEFADWLPDYAPGGEPIIEVSYFGPDESDYLTVTQSYSPYESVTAWVEAQEYAIQNVRLVDNHEVYLIDLSDHYGPLSSATFVYEEWFITIDGTVDFITMQDIVADFLLAHAP